MSYYNSETLAHFFFYGAILSIFLGIVINYKIGVNVFFSTYIIPLITIPFALIHVVIYRIHIEYSHNLDNLIYWELGFYALIFLCFWIYSFLSKNNFYHFLIEPNKINFLCSVFYKNKNESKNQGSSHKDNLKELVLDFESSSSIYLKPTLLFFYIFIVFLILKNTDDNLVNFFYLIEEITNNHEYIAIFFFSLISSIALSFIIRNNNIHKFRRIYDYVSILRLEGQHVLFTKNEYMQIELTLTEFDYESYFNSKTYYFFLNLKDEGIWYYFHTKVDYDHFIEIIKETSYRPMHKFYAYVKELNEKTLAADQKQDSN